MAELEKKSTAVEPKSKKGLLDDDIGKEFLSSWKSMSVTEDDGMDFSFEAVGKGKKNAFNFDKLDMDFNLDGDFNKLSSFKVDMPDLDFSCPPKKTSKDREGNAEESSGGNGQRKKEAFSFSFDFNDMDSFNFDSSLTKGEKTPKKDSMTKEVASVKQDDQGTKLQLSRDRAAHDDSEKSLPAIKSVQASHIDNSETSIAELTSVKTNFSEPANFGSKAQETEARASLDMKMSGIHEETDQQGCLLGEGAQGVLHAQDEDLMTPKSNSAVRKEACYPEEVPYDNTGRDQSICSNSSNTVNENPSFPLNLQPVDPPASDTTKSVHDAKNWKLFSVGTFRDSVDCSEQAQCQLDSEDAPTSKCLKKNDTKFEGQDTIPVKRLDLATVNREPAANEVMPTNSKESGPVCSKFFKRLGDTVNQSDEGPRLVQIGSKRVGGISTKPTEEIRESTLKDIGQESKAVNKVDKILREQKTGLNVAETSKIVNRTSKTGLLNSSSSSETSNTVGVPDREEAERATSSIRALGNSKITTAASKKIYSVNAGATRSLSSLSTLRAPGSAIKQLDSRTLAGGPSTKTSEENRETKRDSGIVAPHPGGSSEKEKQLMLTPSLKRKTYETSNTSMVSYSPLKRLSVSPVESRSLKESSPKLVVNRQSREVSACRENWGDVKSGKVLADSSPSQVDISRVKHMVDYEFTALAENDGNLEKAEAYTKELEDLCHMLKKKQDEAKELLVRAIVNNNHLLMLNHPMFDQKIRSVQKFASRLMATAGCD